MFYHLCSYSGAVGTFPFRQHNARVIRNTLSFAQVGDLVRARPEVAMDVRQIGDLVSRATLADGDTLRSHQRDCFVLFVLYSVDSIEPQSPAARRTILVQTTSSITEILVP
jgi:hypothetical protein